MERYNFYQPITYTTEQAENINSIMTSMLDSVKPVSSLVSNKGTFLKNLKQIASDDQQAHYLSFKPVSDSRFSLHLDPYSGYVNLGWFEVSPDLVRAIQLGNEGAFEHFAFEEVENRLRSAMEIVAQRNAWDGICINDEPLRSRFDMSRFPEVEILDNVQLDATAFDFLERSNRKLNVILNGEGYSLQDEFSAICARFEDRYDFASQIKEIYLDHLKSGEQQVAFFEMSFMEYDDDQYEGAVFLTKAGRQVSDSEASQKTSSALFYVRTDNEVALAYEDAVRSGTTSMMQPRFMDMFAATVMSVVRNFEKNCVLDNEVTNSPINSI